MSSVKSTSYVTPEAKIKRSSAHTGQSKSLFCHAVARFQLPTALHTIAARAHRRGVQYPIIISRDTEIPGARSPRGLDLVQLRLTDVDHMYGTSFKPPGWRLEIRGDRFLEKNLYTVDNKKINVT